MKKLLALVFLVSLAGSARPSRPTLVVNCTATSGGCLAADFISFTGDNYNDRRSYTVIGLPTSGNDATFGVTVDTDGSMSTLPGILAPGTWTFTVLIENNIHRDVATVDVVLE